MALAPKPGSIRDRTAETARFRITMDGRTIEFPATITIQEKMAVRLATQMSFEAFFPESPEKMHKIGSDSLAVLWWLGRRHCGEPHLAFNAVADEWPAVLPEDMRFEVVTDDGEPTDDPEGSGAG